MIASDRVGALPLALEVPIAGALLGVIHADVTSGQWGTFKASRDVWSRDRFRSAFKDDLHRPGVVKGVDGVAVGHTICPEVTVHKNVVHLDTGAFLEDGDLTVLPATEVLAKATQSTAT
jgi:serine/threonine protein phosphatase 1